MCVVLNGVVFLRLAGTDITGEVGSVHVCRVSLISGLFYYVV